MQLINLGQGPKQVIICSIRRAQLDSSLTLLSSLISPAPHPLICCRNSPLGLLSIPPSCTIILISSPNPAPLVLPLMLSQSKTLRSFIPSRKFQLLSNGDSNLEFVGLRIVVFLSTELKKMVRWNWPHERWHFLFSTPLLALPTLPLVFC